MEEGTTFVGLDVHKEAINVAMLLPGEKCPVEWQTSNDPAALRRLVVKTDRRDARKLAELLRAGLLTEVHHPRRRPRRFGICTVPERTLTGTWSGGGTG